MLFSDRKETLRHKWHVPCVWSAGDHQDIESQTYLRIELWPFLDPETCKGDSYVWVLIRNSHYHRASSALVKSTILKCYGVLFVSVHNISWTYKTTTNVSWARLESKRKSFAYLPKVPFTQTKGENYCRWMASNLAVRLWLHHLRLTSLSIPARRQNGKQILPCFPQFMKAVCCVFMTLVPSTRRISQTFRTAADAVPLASTSS